MKQEWIAGLLLLFALLFATQLVNDGRIDHERPYRYLARDSFYSAQLIVDALEQNGFHGRAPYTIDYVEDNYYARPPMLGVLGVILVTSTGVDAYDAGYHAIFFIGILMMALLYVLLRDISSKLAIAAMPFAFLIFTWPFHAFLTAGHWPSALDIFFVFSAVLVYTRLQKPIHYAFFAILIAGGLLSHTREMLGFIIFIFPLFLLHDVCMKELSWRRVGMLALSLAGAVLLYAGFLPYFLSRLGNQKLAFGNFISPNFDTPLPHDIHWVMYGILLLGLACSGYWFYSKRAKKAIPLLFGLGFSLLVFSNAFTNISAKAAAQARFFLPLALAVFFGFAFFFWVPKRWIPLAMVVSLLAVFALHNFTEPERGPVIDSHVWPMLDWLAENIPENETVLSLYALEVGHDAPYWMTKRNVHILLPTMHVKNMETLEGASFRLNLHSRENYVVRDGIWGFEEIDPNVHVVGNDLCDYRYILLQKQFSKLRRQGHTDKAVQLLEAYVASERRKLLEYKNMTILYADSWFEVLLNDGCSGEVYTIG